MEEPIQEDKKISEAKELPDEEVIRLLLRTNDSAFYGIIYDRYANVVYNKCLQFIHQKEIAQDLTHDIFIKLYLKLKTFEFRSAFSTWLYAFTYNFCLNCLNRKHKIKREKEIPITDGIPEDLAEIDDAAIMALRGDKLAKAMNAIDPKDKLILLMKYQDAFSITEIAATLDLGDSAVKMRINRAKARVLEAYQKIEL